MLSDLIEYESLFKKFCEYKNGDHATILFQRKVGREQQNCFIYKGKDVTSLLF